MLDDVFTYGGEILGVTAVCIWLWFAVRAFPSFDAFVKGFDDELHHGDTPEEREAARRALRIRQAAVVLTAIAAISSLIGFAIPD